MKKRNEAGVKDVHQLSVKEGSGNVSLYPFVIAVHTKLTREAGKISPYAGNAGAQLKILLPKKKG